MFVHSVLFWLVPDLDPQRISQFESSLRGLLAIQTIRHGYVGTPAAPDKPVIDRSYSFALTLIFDDLQGHDAYQIDPIHQAFIAQNKPCFLKVQIYDAA
jgi:hypothetical protein